MRNDDAGCIVAILVAVIFFVAGILTGNMNTTNNQELIDRGLMEYDQKTGKQVWVMKPKITKESE